MIAMNPDVDKYLIQGCMRCKFGATPQCKVHSWKKELSLLRKIVLECELTEEIKWGMPCYTVNGKNIAMVSAFKEYASLSFFKGALLKDPHHILVSPSESSQSARLLKFTDSNQIKQVKENIKSYLQEAIELEKSGAKVNFKKNLEPIPQELEEFFLNDTKLKDAFYSLTPGRQRGYILSFSQPKQSVSRKNRIEKYRQQIIDGIGLNDKYK